MEREGGGREWWAVEEGGHPEYKRKGKGGGRQGSGEIKKSRDLREGRWSWTLTFAQKRS